MRLIYSRRQLTSISFLCAVLLTSVLGLATSALSSQPTIPKHNVFFESKITPAQVQVGQNFTVTITFRFEDEVRYLDSAWAGARARLGVGPIMQFVSGDTLLEGRFRSGETYTLTATFKARSAGKIFAGVTIFTYGETDAAGKRKIQPQTATSGGKFYMILQAPVVDSSEPQTTDNNLVIGTFTTMGDPNLAVPIPGKVDTSTSPMVNSDLKRIKLRDSEAPVNGSVEPGSPIIVNLRKLKSGAYVQVTAPIRIPNDQTSRIIFRDVDSDQILKLQHLTSNSEEFDLLVVEDSIYLLNPKSDSGSFEFRGIIEENEVTVEFLISLLWFFDVDFKFVDPFGGNDNRMEVVQVHVYGKNASGQWEFLYKTDTDALGHVSVQTSTDRQK